MYCISKCISTEKVGNSNYKKSSTSQEKKQFYSAFSAEKGEVLSGRAGRVGAVARAVLGSLSGTGVGSALH